MSPRIGSALILAVVAIVILALVFMRRRDAPPAPAPVDAAPPAPADAAPPAPYERRRRYGAHGDLSLTGGRLAAAYATGGLSEAGLAAQGVIHREYSQSETHQQWQRDFKRGDTFAQKASRWLTDIIS